MERFEKVRTLGRGAQGSVILVRRKSDDGQFVIKRIFVDDQSQEDRQDVTNEIKVLAMLKHPNIIGYYGSFVEEGILNVVMEYADNSSLFHTIQKAREPFSEEQILGYGAQLLLAVQHMHHRSVLHRDLKTRNIFLTKEGILKVGDFGLSKIMGHTTSFAQSAVGTPYYLSPELCKGCPYNHKSDVWAVRCVLYELATFKHAFDATNLPALVMSIVNGDCKPISNQYRMELKDFIQSCFVKDPAERPSVEDLLQHPVMVDTALRIREENKRLIDKIELESETCPRPYIEKGIVETFLKNKKERIKISQSVLNEVEEENHFNRFLALMRGKLQVKDRLHGRVPYFKCFTGADMVNYIVDEFSLEARSDAISLCQRWMDAGVFYHVTRADLFVDGDVLYRFRIDEVGSILNLKIKWSGPDIKPSELGRSIRNKIATIYQRYTMDGGYLVDYEGLALSDEFQGYCMDCAALQSLNLTELSFNEKIALFINLYNALVIHGFVIVGPPSTLSQRLYFYNHTCLSIGGSVFSLSDIKHGMLRGNQTAHNAFVRAFSKNDSRLQHAVVVWDPRIHFALIRGTRSCPPLRVYDSDHLDEQLEAVCCEFLSNNVEIASTKDQEGKHQILLPSIFEWYYDDFGASDTQVLYWVIAHLPDEKQDALKTVVDAGNYVLKFASFDWQLNKMIRPQPPPSPSVRSGVVRSTSGQRGQRGFGQPFPPPPDTLPSKPRPSKNSV